MVQQIVDVVDKIEPLPEEHFTETPITIIASPQRQGKSTTAVGRAVEGAKNNIAAIKPPPYDREIKVEPLDDDDLEFREIERENGRKGIAKYIKGTNIKYTNDIIKTLDNPQIIFRIQPTDDNLRPLPEEQGGRYPIIIPNNKFNIFANFHFYGLRANYCSDSDIIAGLHNETIRNGLLIVDQAERIIGNRYGQTNVSKAFIDYSHQFGKMHLKAILIYPVLRIADWIQKYQRTETIECEYNKKTHKIILHITRDGLSKEITYDYDGDVYWRFFNTDETFKISEDRARKAIAKAL